MIEWRARVIRPILFAAAILAGLATPPIAPATADQGTIDALVPGDVGADGAFEVHGSGLALPGLTATLLLPVSNPDGSVADFDHRRLSVVAVADDRVTLRVRSARPGEAFVLLEDAHGTRRIAATQPLVIHAPELRSGEPITTGPGGTVTLAGAWLGGGGTLRIGGARARVESWTQDAITAVVPGLSPDGIHGVEIRNRVGRLLVAGVVEVRNVSADAPGSFVVREQGAERSYIVRSVAHDEATGALDVYASRTGPIRTYVVPGERRWVPGYWEWRWDPYRGGYVPRWHRGYWQSRGGSTWTTQSVRDVRLTAADATFDESDRAIASACSLLQGAHTERSDRGATHRHDRAPTTGLVVLLRRRLDGTLCGSFSGLRKGRLVEGRFGVGW